ncbi:MAG: hypothetical protein GY841_18115 [FCB group bacterium]|nr:hypothetical protein [FCB group bacterium]
MSEGSKVWARGTVILLIAGYAFVAVKNGWVGDDAYITLRIIDNFVNGHGLNWNISERVQSFTHPLWLFVLSIFYSITREPFYTTLFVSLGFSITAVIWFGFKLARSIAAAVLGVAALCLSSAFVDYSTSGLENPLTYLILVLFLSVYFKRDYDFKYLGLMAFLAAMGGFNRPDALLIFLPMLAVVFWSLKGRRAVFVVLIGFLPLLLWELFSFWYYGFFFPNTAYAKLNTGLSSSWMWTQGLHYLNYSIRHDPLTIVVTAGALILPFFFRRRRLMAAAIALALYLLYVVKIGGCFMAGRYLAVPFLLAVVILTQYGLSLSKIGVGVSALVILTLGLSASGSPLYSSSTDQFNPNFVQHGIADERACSTPTHSLYNYPAVIPNDWAEEGRNARREGRPFMARVVVGMFGYFGGPELYVLDLNALTDPLLARLPVNQYPRYRIGHFNRDVPLGYRQTCLTGENHIIDSALAEYYDHLSLIVRGDLFDCRRFFEIIRFNLGQYDYLLEEYQKPHLLKIPYEKINHPPKADAEWVEVDYAAVGDSGIEIQLEDYSQAAKIELSLGASNRYRVLFYKDSKEVAFGNIPAMKNSGWGLTEARISVPPEAVLSSYNSIRLLPNGSEGLYIIGYLRLVDGDIN